MALEHLAELGHRSVGFIGPEWKLDDLGRRAPEVRRQLFSQQLEARGQSSSQSRHSSPMETEAAARAVGERLSNGGTRPTALLAANEETAIGAIRALRLAGLDAPKDLSVVSFNDTPRKGHPLPQQTQGGARHLLHMGRHRCQRRLHQGGAGGPSGAGAGAHRAAEGGGALISDRAEQHRACPGGMTRNTGYFLSKPPNFQNL